MLDQLRRIAPLDPEHLPGEIAVDCTVGGAVTSTSRQTIAAVGTNSTNRPETPVCRVKASMMEPTSRVQGLVAVVQVAGSTVAAFAALTKAGCSDGSGCEATAAPVASSSTRDTHA